MPSLLLSTLFKNDLDNLPDDQTRNQVGQRLRIFVESDPLKHPGLETHPVRNSPTGRKIYESYVDRKTYRILWEWISPVEIGLWRIVQHDGISSAQNLPGTENEIWANYTDLAESDGEKDLIPNWLQYLNKPMPFEHVPKNHLKLLGVPDQALSAIYHMKDAEEIWDLPVPEDVRNTLYSILMYKEKWSIDNFLDTKKLFFRVNVDQLEGYCEGHIKRLMLNLSIEQENLVNLEAQGPVLIKGIAGSGKTTVGLYRAKKLADELLNQLFPFQSSSILILTYTVTLAKALKELLLELYGEEHPIIHVNTFNEWMLQYLYPDMTNFSDYPLVGNNQQESLIGQAQSNVKRRYPENSFLTTRGTRFFLDEICNLIKARGINSLEEYQTIHRTGRKTGLSRDTERPLVWEVYQEYQSLLMKENLVDYPDLPLLTLERLKAYPLSYDAIIIDEAQDLSPKYLQVARQLTFDKSNGRGLTLLADPAQSIYYKGIPWIEGGIEVRGRRTQFLSKNFRNTHQILAAAEGVLEACESLKEDNEYIPPRSSERPGPKPKLISVDTIEYESDFICKEIIKLAQGYDNSFATRYRLGDFVILARVNRSFSLLKTKLSNEDIPYKHFRDDEFSLLENQVKLITMHSAKGLEFPIVFIIDLDDKTIPLGSSSKDSDELEQERKLFYVSMTRACDRLYLLCPKKSRSRFLRDIDPHTITIVEM